MEKTGREEVQRWTQENHEERESRVKKRSSGKEDGFRDGGGGQEEGNRKRRKDARGESMKDVYTSIL